MKDLQEKVDGTFGYRQMTLHMNRKFEEDINHKRIYRLMGIANLRSVIRVKKKQSYKRSTPQHVVENVLNREFTAEKPNEKWVTDVTELKYGTKKAYLSAIRDLYDGSIVSYVLGHSNNNNLVFKTLDQATALLNGDRPLIHSDRRFQYTLRDSNGK
jgi:transposase InsO family protein